jgi:ferredoxin-thioredoxin reductase catalytic subunit
MTKTVNFLIQEFEQYAKKNGFYLSSNKQLVQTIVEGLLRNEEKHGNGKLYCPCRPVTGNEEMDKKNVCPCVYHRDELKRDGKCHCGLFVSG